MRGRRALTRVVVPLALLSVLLAGGLRTEGRHGTTSFVLRTITVGGQPLAVGVNHTSGRGFVANGIRTVSMFDTHAGTVLRTVPVGVVPDAVAVDGRARRVFVANARSNSVSVLDAQTGRVLRSIAVGEPPSWRAPLQPPPWSRAPGD
jgi:YVTN family beta-propeller protein